MMTLSDVTADVRALADVEAFGAVLRRSDSRLQLVTRHRAGVAAHLVPAAALPMMFTTRGAAAGVETTVLPGPFDPEDAFVSRLRDYAIDHLLVVTLPDDRGFFWAGLHGGRFNAEQVAGLATLALRTCAAVDADVERADVHLARLDAIDRVDELLPMIADTLDIRTIFHRLSALTRAVLPHDAATVQLLDDDQRQARVYALDGITGDERYEPFATHYAQIFNEHFQFAIHEDLRANPAERDRPAARSGMRSSIRLPLRFGGRVGGALEFSAARVAAFTERDFGVASRIAEYVALAIAHERMADAAKHAAALRARTDKLLALDDLLATLSGVLDVREVFDRVSATAQQVIRHDAMAMTTVLAEEQRIRIHALSGFTDFPAFVDAPLPEPELLTEPWEFRLVDDLAADPRYAESPTLRAGMRSVLGVPIRLDGRLRYGLNFYARAAGAFTHDDALVARRIGEHLTLALSHQQLAEAARTRTELQAAASKLELLDQLLAAITDTGPLAELFDRVASAAKAVLPHDGMMVPVLLPGGQQARIYARSSAVDLTGVPDVVPVPEAFRRDESWEYDLIGDMATRSEPHNQDAAARGYRSVLRVPIRVSGRLVAGVAFAARAPNAYTNADVLAARRLADRFALCLAREQQIDALQRADEAAARAAKLEARVRALTEELDARTGYRRVLGESASWKQALTQATQVAATDATVLLLGESGTGKEVIARFVHRASGRAPGPFVALNCAALPEQLLEAELFGYERGAFTGATQSKMGQLEQAAGGTLFLDEVGEMSPQVQAKFLRVLQEREFQRLGGTRVLRTDARVVAATNRDLRKAIAGGLFREDLYYRLNVFAIHLPLLRDRRDDILPLSEAFLAEFGRSIGRAPSGISKDARDRLLAYGWPGNVRELRNILERAAILCDGGLITAEHLAIEPAPADVMTPVTVQEPAPPVGEMAAMERAMVVQALESARFNKSKAAKTLGLTRAQLYVRMRRYGLE